MSTEMEHEFDTEKPPVFRWGGEVSPGSATRIPGATVGPDILADFTGNPEAARPFWDWLRSGEAWAAFGDWYDSRPSGKGTRR